MHEKTKYSEQALFITGFFVSLQSFLSNNCSKLIFYPTQSNLIEHPTTQNWHKNLNLFCCEKIYYQKEAVKQ